MAVVSVDWHSKQPLLLLCSVAVAAVAVAAVAVDAAVAAAGSLVN
jgi:hypothetical protein